MVLEKAEKKADAKFKRLTVMESSINGVKQEIDLIRINRLKEAQVMKEEKSQMMSKITKNERLIEDLEFKVEDIVCTYTTDLRNLQHQLKCLEGPILNETKKAQRENEALIREIDRTQTINREILFLSTAPDFNTVDDYNVGGGS